MVGGLHFLDRLARRWCEYELGRRLCATNDRRQIIGNERSRLEVAQRVDQRGDDSPADRALQFRRFGNRKVDPRSVASLDLVAGSEETDTLVQQGISVVAIVERLGADTDVAHVPR
jgi:hypothetical protein